MTFNKNNPIKVKLIGAQKSPYFKINIGKDGFGEEWLLFDTGMDGFYDLSKKHYEIFKKHKIFTEIASSNGGEGLGMFGSDLESTQHKCLLSDLKISNNSFVNLEVNTTNVDNSRTGAKILKYCKVTLKFKDKKIYFDSFPEYNAQMPIDLTERSRKISLTITNDKLVVGFIWDEDLRSKISSGDEIISIDEINYENKNICEIIINKSRTNSNKPVNVIIKTKTVDLITVTN